MFIIAALVAISVTSLVPAIFILGLVSLLDMNVLFWEAYSVGLMLNIFYAMVRWDHIKKIVIEKQAKKGVRIEPPEKG